MAQTVQPGQRHGSPEPNRRKFYVIGIVVLLVAVFAAILLTRRSP